MPLKVEQTVVVCSRCGTGFSKRRGNFYANNSACNKGTGHLPICKACLDQIYQGYLATSGDGAKAVRQMCRKLDLYWNERLYASCARGSAEKSVIVTYLTRLTSSAYAGKCYDDTLLEEDTLWQFGDTAVPVAKVEPEPAEEVEEEDVPSEMKEFWGAGYTPSMYRELQERYDYYLSKMGEGASLDIGGEILLRQICTLEIDINRDRVAGKSVDKNVNALNTLLGSAMLKPVQQKADTDAGMGNTPYGMWIWKFENEEPIPEVDPEMRDVDGIIRYVTIWVFGHICKMLGIKNHYCKLYEDAIAARRVERPELDDEDDDTFIADVFGDNAGDEE